MDQLFFRLGLEPVFQPLLLLLGPAVLHAHKHCSKAEGEAVMPATAGPGMPIRPGPAAAGAGTVKTKDAIVNLYGTLVSGIGAAGEHALRA